MRAAKVQASLRIRAVSTEPSLLAHTSSESRGTFRQKPRSLAPLNGWACAVKICHDGMLEDTNSLDAAQLNLHRMKCPTCILLPVIPSTFQGYIHFKFLQFLITSRRQGRKIAVTSLNVYMTSNLLHQMQLNVSRHWLPDQILEVAISLAH